MDLHMARRFLGSNSPDTRKARGSPKIRRRQGLLVHSSADNLDDAMTPRSAGSLPRNLVLLGRDRCSGPNVALDLSPRVARSPVNVHGERLAEKNDVWQTLHAALASIIRDDRGDQNESSPHLGDLMQTVRGVKRTHAGGFLLDFFEHKILPNEMGIIRDTLEKSARQDLLLQTISSIWNRFYTDTLPKLQLVFSPIKNDLSVREMALRGFRDHVVLELDQCGYMSGVLDYGAPMAVKQMLLVLQMLQCDWLNYQPISAQARLEKLLCLVVPFVNCRPMRETIPEKTSKRSGKKSKETGEYSKEAEDKTSLTEKNSNAKSSHNVNFKKGHFRSNSDVLVNIKLDVVSKKSEPGTTTIETRAKEIHALKDAVEKTTIVVKKKKSHLRSRSDFTTYVNIAGIQANDGATAPLAPRLGAGAEPACVTTVIALKKSKTGPTLHRSKSDLQSILKTKARQAEHKITESKLI